MPARTVPFLLERLNTLAPRRPRPVHFGLGWVVLAWMVFTVPALAQTQTLTQAPATQDAGAAAPALRMPSAGELGLGVPRQVKAATAMLGLGRQRLALVVGNGRLGGRDVLDSAYRDSRAVAAALRTGGFVVMAREDLTAREWRAGLLEFRSRLQPGGIGLIYVAALGAQVDGQNLLLPRELELDASNSANSGASDLAARLKAGGVPVAELVDALMSTPDSPRLLVVDAAYQHPVLARLPVPGLAEQKLPPGMMALFGHALHSVQVVPAVAPLGDKPPDDPREIAASTFGRVLVGAMLTARIKPPDMLRRTRSALFDASGGDMAPWLGGETAGDEEFAEVPITALLPSTPEELAREAMVRMARNLARAPGGGGAGAALLPSPAPLLAGPLPAGDELSVDQVLRQGRPVPENLQVGGRAAEGARQGGRQDALQNTSGNSSGNSSGSLADAAASPGNLAGSLGSAAGTVTGAVVSVAAGAAGVAATMATVAAASAGLNAAGTAAAATVGAAGTAGSLLANAVALGARTSSAGAGAAEPAARATLQAASSLSTPAASMAATDAAAATMSTPAPIAAPIAAPLAAPVAVAASVAAPAVAPVAITAPATAPAPAPAPASVLPGTATAASALAPESLPEPASSGPPVLAPPKFNAFGYGEGDAFLYQVTDTATEQVTSTFMHAIEQVAADGSLLGNGALLQLDPQGRLRRVQRPDGTQARFEPYQDLWQARPKPGQKREVRFKEVFQRADGSRGVIDWVGSSEVGRPVKVRTPGGEFDALPIQTTGRFVETTEGGRPTRGRWQRTVWYAPSLGHPVAVDLKDIDLNGRIFRRERIELMNAQRQPRQP